MTAKLVDDFAKINAELSAGKPMIPDAIRTTIYKALQASLSLATSEYFAGLPRAQRDAAEIREALQWVAEQNCSTVLNAQEAEDVNERQASGLRRKVKIVFDERSLVRDENGEPVVHEGLGRWPRYGARGKRGTIAKAIAWSGYLRG